MTLQIGDTFSCSVNGGVLDQTVSSRG